MVTQAHPQMAGHVLDAVVKVIRQDGHSGSGFVLKDGLVLTCAHVIGGAGALQILLRDSRQIDADVLAADSAVDLAILRPRAQSDQDAGGLPCGLDLGDTSLTPGQDLIAVGHPLGLDWSVTGGHYNATRPESDPSLSRIGIHLRTPLIQVDVAINTGNSGGPVVDLAGRVVGVATSIVNPAVANNIGFVIPADTARQLHDALPMETHAAPTLIPYTCGHYHDPGLAYCPFTGKAIRSPGAAARETGVAAGTRDQEHPQPARCSCGRERTAGSVYCSGCGKPVRSGESRRSN